jgi:hypothetical protein
MNTFLITKKVPQRQLRFLTTATVGEESEIKIISRKTDNYVIL